MKKLLLGLAVVLPAAMVLATKDVQKATSKVNGHAIVYKVTDTIPKDTSKKDTARLR